MKPSNIDLWLTESIEGLNFEVLNLDHPEVEAEIIAEIKAGVPVYYDTRWGATSIFSRWLAKNPDKFVRKTVLAFGAGIGIENLLLARVAKKLIINDFAPVSTTLCGRQLARNNLKNFELFPGDFTSLDFPESDLAVGCYIIYNPVTRSAVEQFLNRYQGPVILVNEKLKAFRKFLSSCERPYQLIFEEEDTIAIQIEAGD